MKGATLGSLTVASFFGEIANVELGVLAHLVDKRLDLGVDHSEIFVGLISKIFWSLTEDPALFRHSRGSSRR